MRIGLVLPTRRPGVLEELLRFLPHGVEVQATSIDIRTGTHAELAAAIPAFERCIGELAVHEPDLIHAGGAPPFLVAGYAGERRIVERWERRFGRPVYTTPMADGAALRALGATRFAGITYFTEDVNRAFEAYFRDAGFTCLGLHAIGVPFARMHELPVEDIDAFARATLQAHPSAQALYLLGAWRAHDILETLERDCGVPAVLSIVANGWAVRKHFQIDEPLAGYGQLLRLA